MATLHLISRCLLPHDELSLQIKHSLSPNDALIFLAEALYSTNLDHFINMRLYRLISEKTFSAQTWLDKNSSQVEDIDYAQFVALGASYERSLSWH